MRGWEEAGSGTVWNEKGWPGDWGSQWEREGEGWAGGCGGVTRQGCVAEELAVPLGPASPPYLREGSGR